MNYQDWNRGIGEHFFHPDQAGQVVLLSVDPTALRKIADRAGATATGPLRASWDNDFVDAVRDELDRRTALGVTPWDIGVLRKDSYPSFLGLLAVQVLAVFRMHQSEDYDLKAYWPRLRELLERRRAPGELVQGLKGEQHQALWRDGLERWGNERQFQGERWGAVRLSDPDAGQRHVAIPKSQALLRVEDLQALHGFFREAGFQRGEQLGREYVDARLSRHARDRRYIRPWTTRCLEDDFRRDLALEQIAEYVAAKWDGGGEVVSVGSRRARRAQSPESLIGRAWLDVEEGDALDPGRMRAGLLVGDERVGGSRLVHVLRALERKGAALDDVEYQPLRHDYLLAVEDSVSGYFLESRYAHPGDRVLLLYRRREQFQGLERDRLTRVGEEGTVRRFVSPSDPEVAGYDALPDLQPGWRVIKLTVRQDLWGRYVTGKPWPDCLELGGARVRLAGGLRLRRRVWMEGAGPSLVVEGADDCLPDTIWVDGEEFPTGGGVLTSDELLALDSVGRHQARLPGRRRQCLSFSVETPSRNESAASLPVWLRAEGGWPTIRIDVDDEPAAGTGWLRGVDLRGAWPWPAVRQERVRPRSVVQLAYRLLRERRTGGRDAQLDAIEWNDPHPLLRSLARVRPGSRHRPETQRDP